MAPQEFPDLWKAWKSKKTDANRENLLMAYLPLVQRVFSRVRIGLSADVEGRLSEDLKHAGVMGLMEAFDHYSEKSGALFSTYASHRIRGAMLDELRRQDWLSKGCRHRLKEIQRAYAEVEQRLGRPASESEVAAHLKISVERFREELVQVGPATLVFLEGLGKQQPGDGQGAAQWLQDFNAEDPEESAWKGDLKNKLAKLIEGLPKQERQVLSLLVHEELGQSEIAEILGLSRSRISQIYSGAVARLQASLLPDLEKVS